MKMQDPKTTVPVLVIGAGPAGLTAAITLARYGIETLVIDRRSEPSTHPRANLVSTGTMELLRSWGLEQEIHAVAPDVVFTGLMGETLAGATQEITLGVPSAEQAAVLSPSVPLGATQDALEPILLRYYESLGRGLVQWGSELLSFAERDGVVRATVRTSTGEDVLEAGYLVGADGVRSRVRDVLEIGQSGPGRILDAMSGIFWARLDGVAGSPRHPIYPITHPEAPDGVFVTISDGDRWGYGFTAQPDSISPDEATAEALERRIRISAGIPGLALKMGPVRRFSYAGLIADRFREGRSFLVGDAAHQVTPRGGTGMNTAIRDGRDIAWKLAWVLKSWAGAELLDSYERERRPVAEHNLRRSVDPNGSIRSVAEELHVDIGPRIPHVWAEPGSSTIDLVGPAFTILAGPDATAARAVAAAVAGRVPSEFHELDAITARTLGMGQGGALLVRPDGVAVGSWSGAAAFPELALQDLARCVSR